MNHRLELRARHSRQYPRNTRVVNGVLVRPCLANDGEQRLRRNEHPLKAEDFERKLGQLLSVLGGVHGRLS